MYCWLRTDASRRCSGRTTFSVLSQNYRTFCALEQDLIARVTSAEPSELTNPELLNTSLITGVVNYLTSMRMFLDHSEADLRRRDKQDGRNRFVTWEVACNAEYNDYFGYRFLYRFRNYIQHVGLPLSVTTFSSTLGHDGRIVGGVFLGEAPEHLLEEFDGWSAVGAELKALSIDLDLSEQVHVSMECLTRIAEALMVVDKPELAESVVTFRAIIGDLNDYVGTPHLVQFAGNDEQPVFRVAYLDIERFRAAEQFTGFQEDKS